MDYKYFRVLIGTLKDRKAFYMHLGVALICFLENLTIRACVLVFAYLQTITARPGDRNISNLSECVCRVCDCKMFNFLKNGFTI